MVNEVVLHAPVETSIFSRGSTLMPLYQSKQSQITHFEGHSHRTAHSELRSWGIKTV